MASRTVQAGDCYYFDLERSLFTVVGYHVGGKLDSWIMSSGDEGHTIIMSQRARLRGDWLYVTMTKSNFKVELGSTWFSVGHNDLFRVQSYNNSREAGPDSWGMLGDYTRRTLYMHHTQRVQGSWLHVSGKDTLEPIPVVRRSRYHRTPVI
jgi:hypothetical protein